MSRKLSPRCEQRIAGETEFAYPTRLGGLLHELSPRRVKPSLRTPHAPSGRLRTGERTLTSACHRLEQAATLFTRAMRRSDPSALLAATRAALEGSPLLYRAKDQRWPRLPRLRKDPPRIATGTAKICREFASDRRLQQGRCSQDRDRDDEADVG
jgi:hypothetical protein